MSVAYIQRHIDDYLLPAALATATGDAAELAREDLLRVIEAVEANAAVVAHTDACTTNYATGATRSGGYCICGRESRVGHQNALAAQAITLARAARALLDRESTDAHE